MPEAILPRDGSIIKPPGSPSHTRRASLKILSRNIDKVVLGNLLFDTWYFSPYPETVIFGLDYHSSKALSNGEQRNGHHEKLVSPVLPKLHVCPYCFKYGTSPVDYVSHLQVHVAGIEADPGDWWPVPRTALKVYEWNGYTVWDVDGEQEKLYCQNLSLFAKLFLEQKSVFFDTAGFHYFVLTYSPVNEPSTPNAAKSRGRRRTSSGTSRDLGLRTQVMGFFSKENLSWDANNLACILVFPPYQHRNLGQLLMAVSYKLSGWEWEDSIIGGPEKPLSTLGRRSYLRFWSERVARFFMGQTADAEGQKVFGKVSKKRATFAKEDMTIKEIGDRTGVLPEDVIAALNEMGICEGAPQKRKKKLDDQQGSEPTDDLLPTTMLIKRSQILVWAEKHNVDLVGPVKEEGFLGEWALSDSDDSGSTDPTCAQET
ncbi:SAS complex subunit [Exophiala xenobiotica]|uniref:histone acetyltransferase n=1 Tax=Lithohypha guttulata TaxID=1690604 RepID=A0ABR0JWX8_9EURO|nr:SAS complex subunit [Lithohypha guttulata]KAK5323762.1 SAS complex subunit [Exophiala xenobiotica]